MYVAMDPRAAFLEAFAFALGTDPGNYIVSQSLLDRGCLCIVTAKRPLHLVDLTTGQVLRRLSANADARISVGTHATSQRWARAFWAHPERPDGILFPCRRAPEFHSVALFARVQSHLVASCNPNLLQQPEQLAALLDHYSCALVP
jgi:hypothetical protein